MVGKITLDGTIGFYVFVGLPFGLVVGLIYVFVARAFPTGLFGGAIYGGTLLVLFSTALEPLRPDNPDFSIVGPGWLAVTAFAAMALGTGVVAAAVAGRIDAALGEPRRAWLWCAVPLGLLTVPAFLTAPLAAVVVAGGCVVYLGLTRGGTPLQRRGRSLLQVALAAAILIALPGFIAAVVNIA